jgi:ribosomal protein S18 acetylase RimI-like enzyme
MSFQIETLNEPEVKSMVCEKILRSLPKWFGIDSAIKDYVRDVQTMPMFIAKDGPEVIGFIALKKHNQSTAEIHVMGILEKYHRQQIGKTLVERAESYLVTEKYEYITVKTLSESRANEEYDRTRRFYLALGFVPLEEFKTLWGEHNPCLFLVKALRK